MNKKYIVLVFIVLFYIAFAIVLGIFTEGEKKYIVFFDDKNLKYDKSWEIINNKKIPDKKFNIVKDGNIISSSNIDLYSNLVDEAIINRNIFAYRGNMKNVIYKKEDLIPDEFIKEILKNNNISIDVSDVSLKYLYDVDINNDDITENIYLISNTSDTSIGDLFSLIVVKNNQNYAIIDIEKFDSEFSSYFPCVYFLDIDNDNNVEMILKKVYASKRGQKLSILKINNEINNYDVIFREA